MISAFGVEHGEVVSKATKVERQRVKRSEEVGAWGGAVGGAVGGYKGVKGAHRVREGAAGGKRSYHLSRDLGKLTQGGGGRLKDLGTAARTGISTAAKAPKGRTTLGAVAGGYAGWMGGAIGGSKAGTAYGQRKNARLRQERA